MLLGLFVDLSTLPLSLQFFKFASQCLGVFGRSLQCSQCGREIGFLLVELLLETGQFVPEALDFVCPFFRDSAQAVGFAECAACGFEFVAEVFDLVSSLFCDPALVIDVANKFGALFLNLF